MRGPMSAPGVVPEATCRSFFRCTNLSINSSAIAPSHNLIEELLSDRAVDNYSISGHAGLATIAEFCHHRAVNGGVDVSIFEDHARVVAAEFHGRAHDIRRGLLQQSHSHTGGPGETDLSQPGVVHESFGLGG